MRKAQARPKYAMHISSNHDESIILSIKLLLLLLLLLLILYSIIAEGLLEL